MKDYKVVGKVINIELENGKIVKVATDYIRKNMSILEIDEEDAILTWLEDEGYLINDEQEELNQEAKKNKVNVGAKAEKETVKKKTQKERTVKENPTKEMVIAEIAKILPNFAENVVIENKGKLITFRIGEDEFKLDLVQKRKKKEDK